MINHYFVLLLSSYLILDILLKTRKLYVLAWSYFIMLSTFLGIIQGHLLRLVAASIKISSIRRDGSLVIFQQMNRTHESMQLQPEQLIVE